MAFGSVCPYSNGCQLKVRSITPECIEVYDGKNKLGTGSTFKVTGKTKEFKIKYNCPDPKEDTKEGRDLTIVLRNTITNDPYTIEVEVVPVVIDVNNFVTIAAKAYEEVHKKGVEIKKALVDQLNAFAEREYGVEEDIFSEKGNIKVYLEKQTKNKVDAFLESQKKPESDLYKISKEIGKDFVVTVNFNGGSEEYRITGAGDDWLRRSFAPSWEKGAAFMGGCMPVWAMCAGGLKLENIGGVVEAGVGCTITYGMYALIYPHLSGLPEWAGTTASAAAAFPAGVLTGSLAGKTAKEIKEIQKDVEETEIGDYYKDLGKDAEKLVKDIRSEVAEGIKKEADEIMEAVITAVSETINEETRKGTARVPKKNIEEAVKDALRNNDKFKNLFSEDAVDEVTEAILKKLPFKREYGIAGNPWITDDLFKEFTEDPKNKDKLKEVIPDLVEKGKLKFYGIFGDPKKEKELAEKIVDNIKGEKFKDLSDDTVKKALKNSIEEISDGQTAENILKFLKTEEGSVLEKFTNNLKSRLKLVFSRAFLREMKNKGLKPETKSFLCGFLGSFAGTVTSAGVGYISPVDTITINIDGSQLVNVTTNKWGLKVEK